MHIVYDTKFDIKDTVYYHFTFNGNINKYIVKDSTCILKGKGIYEIYVKKQISDIFFSLEAGDASVKHDLQYQVMPYALKNNTMHDNTMMTCENDLVSESEFEQILIDNIANIIKY